MGLGLGLLVAGVYYLALGVYCVIMNHLSQKIKIRKLKGQVEFLEQQVKELRAQNNSK